jgi:aminopeptidase N
VRPQDTDLVLAWVASNIYGRDLAWSFFRENFDELVERYGDSYTLGDIIFDVTASFSTETKLQEVKDFLTENHESAGSRSIDQALETIQFNIRWIQQNGQAIADWLQEWSQNGQQF